MDFSEFGLPGAVIGALFLGFAWVGMMLKWFLQEVLRQNAERNERDSVWQEQHDLTVLAHAKYLVDHVREERRVYLQQCAAGVNLCKAFEELIRLKFQGDERLRERVEAIRKLFEIGPEDAGVSEPAV